ncbi:uracil-DNA glycosylase [Maridesulfovibrio sp. FT414]|uniref:uracil-DNA glycosylase n=1 Tax=Maridesulfovibrio sp. FT414 TaxID=2979469 RepID=UPI003D8057C9
MMENTTFRFGSATYQPRGDWRLFFTSERIREVQEISSRIGDDYTPVSELVLLFCHTDLAGVRVVILGQDPYPQPSVATGRAFEVGNIDRWADLKRNASLVNILKLLHKNHMQAAETVGIAHIRSDIDSGEFPILPPSRLFGHLESQGVLFLNTALTCQLNNSGSHTEIWRPFSSDLLRFIAGQRPEARWMLWGKDAQEFCSFVPDSQKLTSYHPRLFDQKPGSFLHENHFAKCPEIDWAG